MTDYEMEIRDKKRLAVNARRRKCGSKSTYCGLPSDHMTAKQWKERCGKVMTYQMNKPMTWEEFRAMPDDLQTQYLTGLRKTLSVTQGDLADMFGVVPKTVARYLDEHHIDLGFVRGKRKTAKQEELFRLFLDGTIAGAAPRDTAEAADAASPVADDAVAPADEACVVAEEVRGIMPAPPAAPVHVHELNLCMDGFFGDELAHKLIRTADSVFGEGTPVRVALRITTVPAEGAHA